MNIQRVNEILNSDKKFDIFYGDKLVWIQDVNEKIATVGFIDGSEDRDVNINDLYEIDVKY